MVAGGLRGQRCVTRSCKQGWRAILRRQAARRGRRGAGGSARPPACGSPRSPIRPLSALGLGQTHARPPAPAGPWAHRLCRPRAWACARRGVRVSASRGAWARRAAVRARGCALTTGGGCGAGTRRSTAWRARRDADLVAAGARRAQRGGEHVARAPSWRAAA